MAMKDNRADVPSFHRGVRSKIAANVLLTSLLAAAVVVLVNVGIHELAKNNDLRYDLTGDERHTLADSTRAQLRGLENDVDLYLVLGWDQAINTAARPDMQSARFDHGYRHQYYKPLLDEMGRRIQGVFREAREVTERVKLRAIDATTPVDEPKEWAQVIGLAPRDMVNHVVFHNPVTHATKAISIYKMFEVKLNGPQPGGGFLGPSLRGDVIEAALLHGIKSVRSAERKVVGVAAGHFEKDLDGVETVLEAEAFEIRKINLGQGEPLPDDLDMLIVASPARQWQPGAKEALARYYEDGGRVLLMQGRLAREDFRHLLQRFGAELRRVQVSHPTRHFPRRTAYSLYGYDFLDPETGAAPHPVTAPIVAAELPVFFDECRAYRLTGDYDRERIRRSVLARAGDGGEAMPYVFEKDSARLRPDLGSEKGDFPMAFAAEESSLAADGETRRSRLVAVASDTWARTQILTFGYNYANRDLLLNMVHWLTDTEQLITSTPRRFRGSIVKMTDDRHDTFNAITTVILPVIVVLAGLLVFLLRRR